MKRLALLALFLVPGTLHTVGAWSSTCGDDCDPLKRTNRKGASVVVIEEPPAPEAPPVPPAPWNRPTDNDEASLRFRHGLGQVGPKIANKIKWAGGQILKSIPRPTLATRPDLRAITGEPSATPASAQKSARDELKVAVLEWVAPDVPRSWAVPDRLVDALIVVPEVKPFEGSNGRYRDLGPLYQATLRCDFSPERRAQIVKEYASTVVARRLGVVGVVIAFVLACLTALAGYIRADEATKGYYTNQLRLVAAGGVGAAGFVAYRLLA